MLDVSNNNVWLRGNRDYWKKFYRAGQRRVYLKLSEGAGFRDAFQRGFTVNAYAYGFRVGRYHFARPSTGSVHAELTNALGALPEQRRGRDLRFCLDVEDPRVNPGRDVGKWVEDFCAGFRRAEGYFPLIYGSYFYLSSCNLDPSKVGPLWLAWYSRDGKYHGATAVPRPWKGEAALQYASTFHYPFMPAGATVDVSHVFNGAALDIPRIRIRRR